MLQLALNAFSVGCAGDYLPFTCCRPFKTRQLTDSCMCAGFGALTPWRPHFAALTAVSLAITHAKYRDRRRTALAALLALALMGTPALVERRNLAGQHLARHRQLTVHVEGMKCLACAARLRKGVQAQLPEPDAACSVDFESGQLSLHNSRSERFDQLLAMVRTQGFTGHAVKQ